MPRLLIIVLAFIVYGSLYPFHFDFDRIEANPLFRNFEKDKTVTGYGISSPGRLYRQILALRNGKLSAAEREAAGSPIKLGSARGVKKWVHQRGWQRVHDRPGKRNP